MTDDGNASAAPATDRPASTSRGWEVALGAMERGANQKAPELAGVLDFLAGRELRCVVEIGTQHGGTLYAWCQIAAPDAVVVSIDLPGGPFGGGYSEEDAERFRGHAQPEQELHFLRVDSHDPATLTRLKEILAGRAVDFLFVDGDHTYYGVRRDFEMYAPLLSEDGLVAFHDILPHSEMREVKVDVLWEELKRAHEHVEFVDPDDDRGWGPWGGIGVLVDAGRRRTRARSLPPAVRDALMDELQTVRREEAEQRSRGDELERVRGEEVASLARELEETRATLDALGSVQAERDELQAERDGLRGRVSGLEQERAELERRLERLSEERDTGRERLASALERVEAERARAAATDSLLTLERQRREAERETTAAQLAELAEEAQRGREAQAFLQLVLATRGWRLLERYRRGRTALRRGPGPAPPATEPDGGPGAVPAPVAAAAPPDPGQIVFRRSGSPRVSIVIPAFNNVEVTLACLASLARNTPHELIEVIVVDDVSTDGTPQALARVRGITAVRNAENLGFTRTCNRGVAEATGEFVLFLNNDVEVEPGWLEALLEAAAEPDVGAVGSKLVYPDGTLQEAGAAIWADGQAWNLGRGGDADAPEWNYRREVDYCSGASLLVRRELLERLGGFDERYAPIYCEDSDLCFAVRAEGFRVLYEPRSVVVHNEGTTHGTDDRPGVGGSAHTKESQYRNQRVFAQKWKAELARQRPAGTKLGYLGGRIDRRPRVLVADMWIPAYDKDSGSRRMTWILTLLRDLGCAVTYFTTDRQRVEPYVSLLQRHGVEVHYGPLTFPEFAEQRADQFDLVFLSRPNVALPLLDDVGRHFPLAPIVYDMSDAHFLREQRKEAVLGPGAASVDVERMREEEVECVRRTDVTTGPTQDDLDVMRELVPDGRFFVLPNAHELDDAPPLPFEERHDLVFIGGFNHDPNVDSALWLVHEILPLVRAEVDARLWLLGSHPDDAVLKLASADVVVPGYLPEDEVTRRFREARVFVSPLRYGAGSKGKIGHAMAFGLPIVTTSIGAEGMDLADGERALVRDSADDFARAVIEVYRDRELWERLSRASRGTVEERWTPEAMRGRLERLLRETLTAGLDALAVDGRR